MPVLISDSKTKSPERKGARRWRKHLLRFSEWVHPQDPSRKLKVTPELVQRLKANFDAGIRDIVPVPSHHTDEWQFNKGKVVALDTADDGLYATFEVDEETDKAIEEEKVLGASAMFDEDWFDLETGRSVGPVLRHVALTNVPVIKRLKGFEPVMLHEGCGGNVAFLSEEGKESAHMNLEEMLEKLKSEHGIDVEALKKRAEAADAADGTLKTVREALAGSGVALSEDATPSDIVEGVKKVAEERKAAESSKSDLTKQVETLSASLSEVQKERKREKAVALVQPHIDRKALDPAKKDEFVALAESNPDLAKSVLEAMTPRVEASGESGTTTPGVEPGGGFAALSEEDAQKEIERYIKQGGEAGLLRVPAKTAS